MKQNETDYGVGVVEPRIPMVFNYDIECTGILGYAYGMWDTSIHKVVEQPILLSFAYSWVDISKVNDPEYEPKIICRTLADTSTYSLNPKDDTLLVRELWELINKADITMGHNSKAFDDKMANMFFMKHRLNPPAPHLQLDTKLIAKQTGRFASNSLNNLCDFFGIGQKTETTHADLWWDIICGGVDGIKAAKKMATYNKQDTRLTFRLYRIIAPWYKFPISLLRVANQELGCDNCLSSNYNLDGTRKSKTGRYQRYVCNDCGHYFSDRTAIKKKDGDIQPRFVSA